MSVSPSSFTCTNAGPNNVTLTVTDACGNTSACTSIVYVQGCTPAWTLTKTSTTMPTNNYDMVGDILTYKLTLVNTGDVSIRSVNISDPLATTGPTYQSGDTDTDNVLDVGETWIYAATHTVTQANIDAGSFTNTATATGTPASGILPPAIDNEAIPALQNPNWTLIKTSTLVPNNYDMPGDVITYLITLQNTGNVSISTVSVADPQATTGPTYSSGDLDLDLILDVGETWSYNATHTATQANVNAGFFTNTATATGTPAGGTLPPASDSETVLSIQTPGILLVKTGTPNFGGDGIPQAGETISYSFTVTNTGNVTLTNITITDPLVIVTGGPIALLLPGGVDNSTFRATYFLLQTDINAGTFTNIATVNGTPPSGPHVTDTDDDTQPLDPQASITLIKTGTLNLAVVPPNGIPNAGDQITYTFTVMNTGNVTLTNVIVTDPLVTIIGSPIASLAPGGSDNTTFSATYTLQQAEINAGTFTNIATVTGTPPTGTNVTDTDDDTKPLNAHPSIELLKTGTLNNDVAAPSGISNAGDQITYVFTVTNMGNVTLTNVTITDPKVTIVGGPIATLSPGAMDNITFSATYTLLQEDIDAFTFVNLATATGTPPTGPDVNDSDDDTQPLNPVGAIELVKTGTPNFGVDGIPQAGETISYTFTVTNTGVVTLTNIFVTDPLVAVSGGPVASLAAGASDYMTFTAIYTLLQSDIDSHSFNNIATVTGTPPVGPPVTDTDDDTQTLPDLSRINLIKTGTYLDIAPLGIYNAGDQITYTFIVTNTGNVTLSNVIVTDPLVTVSGGTIPSLAPGASDNMTFTATYTLMQSDINAGLFTNIATATGTPPSGLNVTDADDDTQNFIQTPGINLLKTGTYVDNAPLGFYNSGDQITYTFSVTNTGNVTLSNVTVTDPLVTVSGGPIASLSPGEVDNMTFTASYTLQQRDIDIGTFTNIATTTALTPLGINVMDTDDDVQNFAQTPGIDVVKMSTTIPNSYDMPGDVLTYSIMLTNTGNITIYNPMMSDPGSDAPGTQYVSGDTDNDDVLDVGESWSYVASHTVTQQNLDNGSYTNVATGTGSGDTNGDGMGGGPGDTPLIDTDPETILAVQTPGIDVVKTSITIPNNYVAVGDILTYTITLANTGNVTVYNPTMSDPGADAAPLYVSGDGTIIGVLEVGETWIYNASHTVSQLDLDNGHYMNVATGNGSADTNGDGIGDTPVTDNDPEIINAVQSPSLNVVKTCTTIPNTYDAVGDVLTFSITMTNDGNVTIYNPTMSDPGADAAPLYESGDGGVIGVLEVGETWTYIASHTIAQQDLDNGIHINVATGNGSADTDGDSIGDTPVTDNDSEIIIAIQTPGINVVKTSTTIPNNYNMVGDELTYSITLTNNGNVTVYNPTMSDLTATTGPNYVSGDGTVTGVLEVGETWIYSASHTVTQQDLDNGSYTNIATGNGSADTNGDSVGDTPVTDNDPETINAIQTPGIDVVKTSTTIPNIYDAIGDILTYSITLTNSGNVTVYNPMMSDPGANAPGPLYASGDTDMDGVLDVSETWTYTANHIVTLTNLQAGSYTNTATGTGAADTDGNGIGDTPVTDNDNRNVPACYIFPLCPITDDTEECVGLSFETMVTTWHIANVFILEDCVISTHPVTIFSNFSTAAHLPGCSDYTGSITLKYWAVNTCGYVTDTITATFTIIDIVAPMVTCVSQTTPVDCPALPVFTPPTATDMCDANVMITFTDEITPGSCIGSYSTTRTWTATDDCGNTSICNATIVVRDITPPSISCPINLTLECNATGDFTAAGNTEIALWLGSVTGSDMCSSISFSNNYNATGFSDGCGATGSQVVIFTATDVCGNSSSCTATITILDTTPPVCQTQDITIIVNPLTGLASITIDQINNGSFDLCGEVSVSLNKTDFTCSDAGPNNIILTVMDECGNSSTCTAIVTVTGCSDLSLDKTVSYNSFNNQATFTIIVVNHGPDAGTQIEAIDQLPSGYSYVSHMTSQGIYSQISGLWTLGDLDSGGAVSLIIVATVNASGVFTNLAQITADEQYDPDSDPGTNETIDDLSDGIQDDDEDTASLQVTDLSLTKAVDNNTPVQGSNITYTITVTNSGPDNATGVVVKDILPGGLVYISNMTSVGSYDEMTGIWTIGSLPNGASQGLQLVATVTGSWVIVNFAEITNADQVDPDSDPNASFDQDDHGDSITDDDEANVAITVDCGICNVINGPANPVCPGTTSIFDAQVTGLCDNPVYHWTVTGNVLNFVPNGSSLTVTAGTICGQAYTVSVSIDCQSCGTSPIVCVTHVLVQDDTPPIIISCAAPRNIQGCSTGAITDPPFSETIATSNETEFEDLTNSGNASDDCGIASVTYFDVVSGVCPIVVTRRWTVSDACGNSSSCNQTIIVNDTTSPTITACAVTRTIEDCNVGAITGPAFSAATTLSSEAVFENVTNQGNISDACDITSVTYMDVITGSCPTVVIRHWTISDACGNSSTCHQTINVSDTTAPFFTFCPVNSNINCPAIPVFSAAVALDECDPSIVITPSDITIPGTCPGRYSVVRTWTAVDDCGNSATCSATITVQDNTAPQIHCPSDLVLTCDAGQNYVALINAWIATTTSTDACDVNVSIANNYDGTSIPDFSCQGGLVITFTATDECGNTSTCIGTVTKPCFTIESWVYLEGSAIAPDGGSTYVLPMRTTLNEARLLPGQMFIDPFFGIKYSPAGQPYNISPWNYLGTEGSLFDSGGNPLIDDAGYPASVVDWVLVSLRLDSAGTGGPVCRAAALLHNDGTIQFVEPLNCCDVSENTNYYLVIEHRNHLIVMSHAKVSFINHRISYDFRFQQSWENPLFANLFAREKEILPGKFAMYGGNGKQTGSLYAATDINFDDRSFWESQNGFFGFYLMGDYNLNGDPNFNDRNVWERNNGKFTSVPRN
ncbi:MAG: hypothetical protein WBP41_08035 [Saprospiraceae bacterium]